jgi:hypothetical protein
MVGFGKELHLKWFSLDKSIKVFRSIFNSESEGKSLDSMLGWIRAVLAAPPLENTNVLLFNTPTGLRLDESHKAIYLVDKGE